MSLKRFKYLLAPIMLAGFTACQSDQSVNTIQSRIVDFIEANQVDSAAHWVRKEIVLIPSSVAGDKFRLVEFPNGLEQGMPDTVINLSPLVMPKNIAESLPHLRGFNAYQIDPNPIDTRSLFRSQLAVIGFSDGHINSINRVQFPHALDDFYTSGENDADEVDDLGANVSTDHINFKVWAPTARDMSLEVYNSDLLPMDSFKMAYDADSGIWSAKTTKSDALTYYRYKPTIFHPESGQIETYEVTDPYSLCLSANSAFSCVVDLNAPDTKPEGWDSHTSPSLAAPEEQIIYEAHIGDFSGRDASTPKQDRGKYNAFQHSGSAPMRHLAELAEAGLNTFHILPAYDIGTVLENPGEPIVLTETIKTACTKLGEPAGFCQTDNNDRTLIELLSSFDPLSGDAQAVIEAINEADDFNWGYDPVHYTVPEGSYASDANGLTRIVEFRQMVQTLHEMDLRVVMDVVYNHAYKSGMEHLSVLDKLVPGYYHRRHPITGAIEQSTCCENTATEHAMMGKLMTDSLVAWARDYKIDGFRFDLMGHQPRDLMLKARDAVQEIDPDNYFYGEGWNFGEVANNAQFRQATQTELAGTSIGTFTDRMRDAVRGGRFNHQADDLRRAQGIGNGQFVSPNNLNPDPARDDYENNLDILRLGLVGNLADFELIQKDGTTVTGKDIPYGDAPAGYAQDPADTINYVSKHDNQTLWDNHQYRLPYDFSIEDRVKLQVQSLSYVLLGQGIPFMHMGSETLRSKSYLRDSYNFGHWFNHVDFTYQSNNYNVGLPPAIKDKVNWPIIQNIIAANEGRDTPSPEHIKSAKNQVMDLIRIRNSSPLFRLQTAEDIKARVRFLNTGPDQIDGLIVMSIDDGYWDQNLEDLDESYSEILVAFNHSPKNITYNLEGASALYPLNLSLPNTYVSEQELNLPAFTTVVLARR